MKLRYVICLSAVVLSVASAAKMQNIFGRMPLCLIISIVLLSAVYAAVVYKLFAFTENSADKICTRGRTFHYKFNLVNDTAFVFPHISVSFFNGNGKMKKDLAVKPHGCKAVEVDYCFKHIGKYSIGFLDARIYDLLNLFFIPYRNYRHEVVVVPRIDSIGSFINLRKDDESQQLTSFLRNNNSANYDGVRNYVPGDSLKRVHWKLTAHTGTYMSRLDENPGNLGMGIFIDLYKPQATGETALSIYDCVVESAFAAANYGIKQHCDVHLVFNRQKQTIAKAVSNIDELQEAAERFALYGYDALYRIENLIDWFRRTRGSLLNFVVCTPNLDYDLAYYMAELKSLGKNPLLFYVVSSENENIGGEKITEYIQHSGIDIRKIKV